MHPLKSVEKSKKKVYWVIRLYCRGFTFWVMHYLKGPWHEIFDLCFLSSHNPPYIGHCCDKKLSLVNPHIFCVKVIGIVQDNLPMNVFSIDIPFKGSQSHSNMRYKVTACHICTVVSLTPLCMSQRCQSHRCASHSGVNDTAVHVTVVPMTLLCMSQRCQWHRCAMSSWVRFPYKKNSVATKCSYKKLVQKKIFALHSGPLCIYCRDNVKFCFYWYTKSPY
jgi:hypothetical protein